MGFTGWSVGLIMVGLRLYINTGDILPPIIWTDEQKEALRQAILKARKLEGLD